MNIQVCSYVNAKEQRVRQPKTPMLTMAHRRYTKNPNQAIVQGNVRCNAHPADG